jgi:hypothetical protein
MHRRQWATARAVGPCYDQGAGGGLWLGLCRCREYGSFGGQILDSVIQPFSSTLEFTENRRPDRWLKHSLMRFGVIIQR